MNPLKPEGEGFWRSRECYFLDLKLVDEMAGTAHPMEIILPNVNYKPIEKKVEFTLESNFQRLFEGKKTSSLRDLF